MSGPSELITPYKGLFPYSAEDTEFFFGRERERNFITANLLAERLTLLYGASGVGKSSVLRAGVEHHIRLLTQDNLRRLGKPKYILVVFSDWADPDPLRSLVTRVEETLKQTLGTENVHSVDPSLGLVEALLEWSKYGQLLIILDQFEEYFLYHQDENGPSTFAEEFPRAVTHLGLPVNFLVSFREDAFAKLAFFKVRMPEVFGNYLPLQHLDYEAGRDAIQKPIDHYNKKFGNGRPLVSIEPELVEEVLKQVEAGQVNLGEAGRGTLKKETSAARIETPFLQIVMMRLWEDEMKSGSRVLRLETLEQLADQTSGETGSVRIVRTHLDNAMAGLSTQQQDIAAEIFHYLVTPSRTKIAHTAPDLAEYASVSKEQVETTLEGLAKGSMRILRSTSADGGEPRYEIFHDAMALPILDWRHRRIDARKAENQRREAEKKAREEEQLRSVRRMRVFALILAVMFVFAVVAAIFAWRQQSKAQAASQLAIVASQQATAARNLAESNEIDAKRKAEDLEKANIALQVSRKNESNEKERAIANEARAVAAAAQANRDLREAKNQIAPDLVNANNAFNFATTQTTDDCDKQDQLRRNLKQYCDLIGRYVALRATEELAHTRRRIAEINGLLRTLKCEIEVPYKASGCDETAPRR